MFGDIYDATGLFGKNLSRDSFIATGLARDMLVEAFSRLPNLRIVGLRDYNGKGRDREGEGALWRSYGWSLANPSSHLISRASPNQILPLILYALGVAVAKPENLEIFLRWTTLQPDSFDVSGLMAARVSPVLHGLKTLLLTLRDGRTGHSLTSSLYKVHHFLQQTPLLEHLRLNFNSAPDPNICEFLSWLAMPVGSSFPDAPCTPVPLKHLTRLDLGMLAATNRQLVDVIARFTTLEFLSLWKIQILADSDTADVRERWTLFLSDLAVAIQQPDKIANIAIGWASQEGESSQLEPVQFAGKISTDANGEKSFEDVQGGATYRKHVGSDVCVWLRDLAERPCRPPRRRRPSIPEEYEEDDSSETEDQSYGDISDGSDDSDSSDDEGVEV